MLNINETLFSDLKSTRRVFLSLLLAITILSNLNSDEITLNIQGNIFSFSLSYILFSLVLFSILSGYSYFYHVKKCIFEINKEKLTFITKNGMRHTWDKNKIHLARTFWMDFFPKNAKKAT